VDGKALPPALIGAANPTDPGTHRVQASAAGLAAAPVAVELKEGARETITVQMTAATSGTEPVGTVPTVPASEAGSNVFIPSAPSTGADAASSTSSVNGLRIGSYVAMGVGVVGLGAGTFFALKSTSKRDEADEICPNPKRCPDPERERVDGLDDDSGSAQKLAIVGFVAGGVGVATGVTLFVLSGKKKAPPASASIRPWVGPLGVGVDGTF
jgi:hypothetical protein